MFAGSLGSSVLTSHSQPPDLLLSRHIGIDSISVLDGLTACFLRGYGVGDCLHSIIELDIDFVHGIIRGRAASVFLCHGFIAGSNIFVEFAAIESLPEEYQRILWMSYREGLKNAEIAARLGVAEITVKKKKAKILALLSSRMGDISPAVLILMMTHLRV